jgi:hypothetical protein
MAINEGYATKFAFKHATGAVWGSGSGVTGPATCGAGDQIQVNQEGIENKVALIKNRQVSGLNTPLAGVKGTDLSDGPVDVDCYYQGLEPLLACFFGIAGVPTTLAAGAYKHTLQLGNVLDGIMGTAVASEPVWIREWPFCKVDSLEFTFEPGKQGKLKVSLIPFLTGINIGATSTINVVANAADANVAYSLLLTTLVNPSQLTIVHTGTPTGFNLTIVGTDADGNLVTEVFSLITAGTFNTVNYYATITSITGSALSGTPGTTQVGTLNGLNNATTVLNLSLPANQPYVLSSQLTLQAGLASVGLPATVLNISKFMLKLDRKHKKNDVTTRFVPRAMIDEPVGDDFVEITGGINFSKLMTENDFLAFAYKNKFPYCMKAAFSGGLIGATAFPYAWNFLLPGVQFETGKHNLKGPVVTPFDLTFWAARGALGANPPGFPVYSNGVQGCVMEIQSARSTDALT